MEPKKPIVKAYKNLDFLNSPDARTIRLLAEYLEPQQRFRRHRIQDTIVFFGSARIHSREKGELLKKDTVAAIEARGRKGPSKDLIDQLQHAEVLLRNSRYYDDAVELAKVLTEWAHSLHKKGRFVICSGGGPGIMEAANRGAHQAGGSTIGLNISLPFEQHANPYIPPDLNMEFHYFFMRKFWFIYPSKALVVFPGGFGTLDELFEVLTLVQTGKLRKDVVVVLYGKDFWSRVLDFDFLVSEYLISKSDLNLFKICDTPKEAFAHLKKQLTERFLG